MDGDPVDKRCGTVLNRGELMRLQVNADSSKEGRKFLARLAFLLCACSLSACQPLPPPAGFAKFVRRAPAEAGSGSLGFATGAVYADRNVKDKPDDKVFLMFPIEGFASMKLADAYDLSASINSLGVLSLEGDLVLLESRGFLLGIPHGIGFSYYEGDERKFKAFNASGGLFLQGSAGRHLVILGVRYTYALAWLDYYSEELLNSHCLAGSLGFIFRTSRLSISFEVTGGVESAEVWSYEPTTPSASWFVMPLVGFSVAY
jgi:hypothetical protein